MRKKILCVLMVFVFMAVSMPTLANDNLQDLRDQADAARAAAQETAHELDETRIAINQIKAELMELDLQLSTAIQDLLYIEYALETAIAALEQTEYEWAQAQEDLNRQNEAARARLRAIQDRGSTGLLSVVLQATSLRDFLLRLEYVNNIARQDQEMIARLEATESRIAQLKDDQARQVNSVESLHRLQDAYISVLADKEAERIAFFEELQEDEERLAAWLVFEQEQADLFESLWQVAYDEEQRRLEEERRERERRELEQRLLRMANLGGILAWPVPSSDSISSPFGPRMHPINRRWEHHDGIDIRARSGANIVAAEAGTVIFSGWRGGFGNTVIIDHGSGLHTLYAHNSLNVARVGDWVNRGQVIAHIGSTGLSTGPHLHFEVRMHGQVQDPGPFLGLR